MASKKTLLVVISPVNGKWKNQTFTELFKTQDEMEKWLDKLLKQLGKNVRFIGYIHYGEIKKVWL